MVISVMTFLMFEYDRNEEEEDYEGKVKTFRYFGPEANLGEDTALCTVHCEANLGEDNPISRFIHCLVCILCAVKKPQNCTNTNTDRSQIVKMSKTQQTLAK